jgi:hypothetical protein
MKILSFLLGLIVSGSSLAKVEHIAEYGFVVKNTFNTTETPEKLWLALVNDADTCWPKDHS